VKHRPFVTLSRWKRVLLVLQVPCSGSRSGNPRTHPELSSVWEVHSWVENRRSRHGLPPRRKLHRVSKVNEHFLRHWHCVCPCIVVSPRVMQDQEFTPEGSTQKLVSLNLLRPGSQPGIFVHFYVVSITLPPSYRCSPKLTSCLSAYCLKFSVEARRLPMTGAPERLSSSLTHE